MHRDILRRFRSAISSNLSPPPQSSNVARKQHFYDSQVRASVPPAGAAPRPNLAIYYELTEFGNSSRPELQFRCSPSCMASSFGSDERFGYVKGESSAQGFGVRQTEECLQPVAEI